MWRRTLYALVGVSLSACAAAGPSMRPGLGSAGREVLTAAEIVAAKVTDAYQAVSQLRPEFLRKRAAIPTPRFGTPTVAVYLDDLQFGGAESLRSIPLERVRTIRYISPIDADLRWGGSHPSGVILVTTLR